MDRRCAKSAAGRATHGELWLVPWPGCPPTPQHPMPTQVPEKPTSLSEPPSRKARSSHRTARPRPGVSPASGSGEVRPGQLHSFCRSPQRGASGRPPRADPRRRGNRKPASRAAPRHREPAPLPDLPKLPWGPRTRTGCSLTPGAQGNPLGGASGAGPRRRRSSGEGRGDEGAELPKGGTSGVGAT